ncbi:MAG: hypothetical protein V7K69_20840 [Nostoc sp.]|uniref:hypothetical protein n=1 Tax=Nostoc sp. TaxID=1180 RepID=UPI002FFCAB4E
MPVTIGTLNSNLNLVDSNNTFNEAMMEKIIQAVMMRLKQEMYEQEKSRSEGDISNSRTA